MKKEKKTIKIIIKGKKCPAGSGLFKKNYAHDFRAWYADYDRGLYIGYVCQKCGLAIKYEN